MKTPMPRMPNRSVSLGKTWLETEELCYGGDTRRARVRFPDGKLRVVRCRLADTFFSIPCNHNGEKGFISSDDSGFQFTPYQNQEA